MSAITPDTDDGIRVFDANGIERVTIGRISPPSEGNPTGDYGIKVVDPSGNTEILDGTSNVFKVRATGTLTVAGTALSDTTADAVLTELGVLTTTPAHVCFLADGTSPTTSAAMNPNPYLVPSSDGTSIFNFTRVFTFLNGSGFCVVRLVTTNHEAFASPKWARYYVFAEPAL